MKKTGPTYTRNLKESADTNRKKNKKKKEREADEENREKAPRDLEEHESRFRVSRRGPSFLCYYSAFESKAGRQCTVR